MGENRNKFGAQLGKARYRGSSTSGVFGATNISDASLNALLFSMMPPTLVPVGLRAHVEMSISRELVANSPYVIDCQNFWSGGRRFRLQMAFETDQGK